MTTILSQATNTVPSQVTFDFVPLHLLSLSPQNVRNHYSGDSIESLAALIRVDGVLQNLVVYAAPQTGRARRKGFLVAAGGRRWRALMLLLQQGHISKTFPVPCQIRPGDRATEVSLAENVGQEPMHPADEFDAFKKVVDAGATVGEVALRFGVKPLLVQQRLKLANVHPHFIGMYREKKLTLEHLMALAITDDHEHQMKVWAGLPDWRRTPDEMRQMLTRDETRGDDPLALLVGVARYEQAGGFVRRDLFGEEGEETFFTDPQLLRDLAVPILEEHASKLKEEGVPWVEVVPHFDYPARAEFVALKKRRQDPTPEVASQLASLQERSQVLADERDQLDPDDARYEGLEAELNATDEKIDAIEQSLLQVSADEVVAAGAVVTVAEDGSVLVERLLRKGDPRASTGVPRITDSQTVGAPAHRSHSIALTRRLTSHRTAALQATIARQPTVALVALTHRLVADAFYERPWQSALQITTKTVSLRPDLSGIEQTPAYRAIESLRDELRALLPEDPQLLFQWLADQTQETLLRLLALCVSSCVDAVTSDDNLGPSVQLARAAHLDMHEWWKPTAADYFTSLTTTRIMEIIKEVCPDQSEAPLKLMRKPALALTAEEKVATAGWLPTLMRDAEPAE